MKLKHTLFSWLITGVGGFLLLLLTGIAAGYDDLSGLSPGLAYAGVLMVGMYLLFLLPVFIVFHLMGAIFFFSLPRAWMAKLALSGYAILAIWVGQDYINRKQGNELTFTEHIQLVWGFIAVCIACIWLLGGRSKNTQSTNNP